MVNPIPAREPVPNNCFKLVLVGNFAILKEIITLLKIKIPTGLPITNPAIIPILIESFKELTISGGTIIAVFAKAKSDRIIKFTTLCIAISRFGIEFMGMANATNTPLILASIPELKIIYHRMKDRIIWRMPGLILK